jgi:hypothetical protein
MSDGAKIRAAPILFMKIGYDSPNLPPHYVLQQPQQLEFAHDVSTCLLQFRIDYRGD